MPYVSTALLRTALDDLKQGYSPLLMISLPCMLYHQIPTCGSMAEATKRAIEFGSPQETDWLDAYFKPGGGPPGLPWYMPGTGNWVEVRYPQRALQRRRKDFEDSVFFHPTEKTWALRKGFARILRDRVLEKRPRIPLLALMLWIWRDKEIANLRKALDRFTAELGFDRDDLAKTIYSMEIDPKYKGIELSPTPLTPEAIADLIGAAPPPPQVPEFPVSLQLLEDHLNKQNVLLVPGLVRRVIGAWLVGDIVVLLGPPGVGKTFLSIALGNSLASLIGKDRFRTIFIEVNRDTDLAEFLGYENLSGQFIAGKFTREALLAGETTDPKLVILDEWNLAQIDTYFAPILSCLETGKPIVLPGRLDLAKLPGGEEMKAAHPELDDGVCGMSPDTFFIATCNSWTDEPETRLPLSGPVKRRSRIISVPNLVEILWETKGREGIAELCDNILAQEKQAIEVRKVAGRPSILDAHRTRRLDEVGAFAQLEDRGREKLNHLTELLIRNVHTKSFFTVGLLRDIFLSCVYSEAGEEFRSLGEEVADKILQQVRGETKLLEQIVEMSKDLPNAKEITELARKMGAFSGAERRIKPLV